MPLFHGMRRAPRRPPLSISMSGPPPCTLMSPAQPLVMERKACAGGSQLPCSQSAPALTLSMRAQARLLASSGGASEALSGAEAPLPAAGLLC